MSTATRNVYKLEVLDTYRVLRAGFPLKACSGMDVILLLWNVLKGRSHCNSVLSSDVTCVGVCDVGCVGWGVMSVFHSQFSEVLEGSDGRRKHVYVVVAQISRG